MQPRVWILVLAAAADLSPSHAATPRTAPVSEANSEVTVYVGKLCPAATAVWKIGSTTARDLYSRIGVRLRFVTGSPPAVADNIELWVVDRPPRQLGADVLGTALFSPEYDPLVYVFFDRVARFYTSAQPNDTGVVMGYVIAHEVGHVLRGEGHSETGVMKGRWNPGDVHAMLHGVVDFTKEDSARIRRVVAERSFVRTGVAGVR